MRGQWFGAYSSNSNGRAMVNIDELDDRFEAVAYLTPSTGGVPGAVAFLSTPNKDENQTATAYINPIDPRTGFQAKWEDIKSLFEEGMTFSSQAKVDLRVRENKLYIDALSDNGVAMNATLEKSLVNDDSKIHGQKMSWETFKSHLSGKSKHRYIFRGQQKPWSLRTAFHRRGRFRMTEFTGKDVRKLHQRLSAITSHFFDLTVPDQNGAFFNLLQHHGYPTPLLGKV